MILIKYSKLCGAEFIPHLDTLRHLIKTIRRMGVNINYSQGFNPHMLIYMSSPIALGLKSESEFCLFDTDHSGEGFKELFNSCTGFYTYLWSKKALSDTRIYGRAEG